jgi:prepilin-type N-terminal cleavage/methylation domain-containing protein
MHAHERTTTAVDDGFTLIELLVVMIIIGILAAIAIPTFLHQRQNAIGTSQIADLRSVADEVEGFYVDQDTYPTTTDFAWSNGQVTISSPQVSGVQRVTVGNAISYQPNAGGTAYCIVATNPKAAGPRVWVSSLGGVQPFTTSSCPAVF